MMECANVHEIARHSTEMHPNRVTDCPDCDDTSVLRAIGNRTWFGQDMTVARLFKQYGNKPRSMQTARRQASTQRLQRQRRSVLVESSDEFCCGPHASRASFDNGRSMAINADGLAMGLQASKPAMWTFALAVR